VSGMSLQSGAADVPVRSALRHDRLTIIVSRFVDGNQRSGQCRRL